MKKFICIALLGLSTPLIAMETREKEQSEVKALLFDLGGIFFDKSMKNYVTQLGVEGAKKSIGYLLLDWKAPWNLKSLIFEVLNNADVVKDEDFQVAHDKGKPMPYLLSAYQAGLYSLEDAKRLTFESFEQLKQSGRYVSERQVYLIQRGIELMFSPKIYAEEIIEQYPAALRLLKELRMAKNEQGEPRFRLVALSNWDKDSFAYMRQRFAEELGWFDDLVISGESGSVKPNKALYDLAVEKAGVAKEECLFVDDQQENVEAAEKLGIPSVLFKNTKQFRKAIEERELLAESEITDSSPLSLVMASAIFIGSGAWLLFNAQW